MYCSVQFRIITSTSRPEDSGIAWNQITCSHVTSLILGGSAAEVQGPGSLLAAMQQTHFLLWGCRRHQGIQDIQNTEITRPQTSESTEHFPVNRTEIPSCFMKTHRGWRRRRSKSRWWEPQHTVPYKKTGPPVNSRCSSIFYDPRLCATVHIGRTSKWEQEMTR